MFKRFALASAALSLTLVAGSLLAGGNATAATPPGSRLIVPATGLPLGEMPTATQRAKALRSKRLPNAIPANAHLTYYGGPVMSSPKVVTALWGAPSVGHTYIPQVSGSTTPNMDNWFSHVTNSAHFSWLSEYNTPAAGGTNQKITYGGFVSRATITPSTAATTVLDSDIQSSLISAIGAGTLAAPTADATGNVNTIYAVYFPSDIVINDGQGNLSGVVFCAYHGATTALVNGMHVPYMVLPDPTSSGMNVGCGQGTAFQNLESYTSHELVEALTDPMVPFASTFGPPLGWYDANNGEIGDICNQLSSNVLGTDGVTYLVQNEWSNGAANCVATRLNTTPGSALNVKATLTTPTSVNVAWDAPASDGGTAITSWTLYQSTDGTLGTPLLSNIAAGARSVSAGTIVSGSAHYYTLVAVNANGAGAESARASVNVVTAPGAPVAVAASLSAANTITTSWNAPSSNGGGVISGYSVYRYVSGQPTATHIADVPSTQLFYSDSSVVQATSYEYTVRASNSAGPGPESSHSNAVLAVGPASEPQSFATSNAGANAIAIEWTAPADNGGTPIVGYRVYRSPDFGVLGTDVSGALAANATVFIDNNLPTGAIYFYSVVAINSCGEGTPTNQQSAFVVGLPGPSGSVSAYAIVGGQAHISWSTPASDGGSPIVGYHVVDNTGLFTCDTTTELTCVIGGLTPGASYTFKVYALSAYGPGTASASSAAITAGTTPGAPTVTSVVPGNKQVRVNWAPVSDTGGLALDGYKVTASPGGATCAANADAATCVITGLTNGTKYTFTVTASNFFGNGAASAPSATVAPRTIPGTPRLLKATYAAGHKTTVTWSAPASNGGAAVTAYSVRWSANGKTWSAWSSTRLARSWSHTGFKKGVRVYVQVAASNVAGRGAAAQIALKPTK